MSLDDQRFADEVDAARFRDELAFRVECGNRAVGHCRRAAQQVCHAFASGQFAAPVLCINPRLTPGEVTYILEDGEVEALFVDRPRLDGLGPERGGFAGPVRVLGEDFAVFKTGDGGYGIVDERCPHRGASLVYGIVDDDGLRCGYHGWKFDTEVNQLHCNISLKH